MRGAVVYARAHYKTVEEDYFAAMSRIETRLALVPEPEQAIHPVQEPERIQLLALADRLVEPELSFELRLEIAFQIRWLVNGQATTRNTLQNGDFQGRRMDPTAVFISSHRGGSPRMKGLSC